MFNIFSKKSEPIKFWFETDIHCHVLPGVDDGSPDPQTSVGLVRDLAEMGIKKIIATPHITETTFENDAATLDAAQAQLDRALSEAGIDIPVTHAAENRIDRMLSDNMKAGTLLTYPGNFILIENSFAQEPWGLENIVFELQVRGLKPILAHPERYLYYHTDRKRYKELAEHVDFQINMLSLAGYYGKNIRKIARDLAQAGMVKYLGTDSHGQRHIDCLRQYLAGRDARSDAKLLANVRNDIDFA